MCVHNSSNNNNGWKINGWIIQKIAAAQKSSIPFGYRNNKKVEYENINKNKLNGISLRFRVWEGDDL